MEYYYDQGNNYFTIPFIGKGNVTHSLGSYTVFVDVNILSGNANVFVLDTWSAQSGLRIPFSNRSLPLDSVFNGSKSRCYFHWHQTIE